MFTIIYSNSLFSNWIYWIEKIVIDCGQLITVICEMCFLSVCYTMSLCLIPYSLSNMKYWPFKIHLDLCIRCRRPFACAFQSWHMINVHEIKGGQQYNFGKKNMHKLSVEKWRIIVIAGCIKYSWFPLFKYYLLEFEP